MPTASEIKTCFEQEQLNAPSLYYIDFHKYRYKFLIDQIEERIKAHHGDDPFKILDIGPSFQTFLVRKYFPNTQIDTLGYEHPYSVLRQGEKHYNQDLNQVEKTWNLQIKGYDLILFCEVIEHLYSRPEESMNKFYDALNKNGCIIIQTPNAVAIHKRLRLMIGRNPYELLRSDRMGHFREYTPRELDQIAQNCQLSTIANKRKNYFNYNTSKSIHFISRIMNIFEWLMPPSWRDGITLVVQKKQ